MPIPAHIMQRLREIEELQRYHLQILIDLYAEQEELKNKKDYE